MPFPERIETVEQLDELLSRPPKPLVEFFSQLEGDIVVLGAGGKMGPSLAEMAVRASRESGRRRKVIAASRFSTPGLADRLAEMPAEEVAPEMYVFRPHERMESVAIEITREAQGIYRLSGEEITRLANMTDWSNDEGIERFERIMISRGISSKLEEAGVQFGDTVLIGDFELEWR